MRLFIPIALCLTLGATKAAAEVSAEGAQALAVQLRAWIAGMLGPDAPVLPLRAEAEGDHYRVSVPLIGPRTPQAEPVITAAARPQDDGRWAIDDIRVPSTLIFTRPGGETTVTPGNQHAHGLLDPALITPSSFAIDGSGMVIAATDPNRTQEQRIDRYALSGAVKPESGGLLEVTEQGEIDGWRSAIMLPAGPASGTGARLARAIVRIEGLRRDRVPAAVAALVSLGVAMPAPSPGGAELRDLSLTPEARAALHRLVAALAGIAGTLRIDETLEGVQVEIAGLGGAAVDTMRLGMGGEAAGGLVRGWLDLGLDGLSVPGLPPETAALVPRRVTFRPTVSGVPSEALNRLLAAATEPGADAPGRLDPEIAALFAQGSLAVGIDALGFAIGPAEFSGAGSVLLLSPAEREGQARITATGFDALTEQARGDPALTMALPVLVLARGLAKAEGDRLVWAIATDRAGKLTVNGVDLSALMGGKGR